MTLRVSVCISGMTCVTGAFMGLCSASLAACDRHHVTVLSAIRPPHKSAPVFLG